MNLSRLTTATALAASTMLVFGGVATAAHVDFFDSGPFDVAADPGESQTVTQSVPAGDGGALGGLRQVTVSNDGPSQQTTASLSVDDPRCRR